MYKYIILFSGGKVSYFVCNVKGLFGAIDVSLASLTYVTQAIIYNQAGLGPLDYVAVMSYFSCIMFFNISIK